MTTTSTAQRDPMAMVHKAASAVVAGSVVALLYFGREVFVPIALAVLLSFVLAPLVYWLQELRFPRAAAVILVVLVACAAMFAVGGAIATQVSRLSEELPKYQKTMQAKIEALRGFTAGSGTLERAAGVLDDLTKELDKKNAPAVDAIPASTISAKPLLVEVRPPDPGVLATISSLIAPLIHPLTTTGITIIFAIFILLQREDIRNRMIRLAGSGDLQQTTLALDDAGSRLSRLFLTQLAVNVGFGIVIAAGLWLIGVPNAPLWGVLGTILRFIPYIGAVISAAFPMALAAAVDPGWSMLVWTAALFLIVEPIIGHAVEPMLYGQSTGLSPLAIVIAATFWTSLWGPIGLVLATPLTICLVVLGRHVEQLEFLDILLGDEPALTPEQMFYQRMLADDPAEAAEQAEKFLKQHALPDYYDSVAAGGLKLAQLDVARGVLEKARLVTIRNSIGELVDDLSDYRDLAAQESDQPRSTTPAVATVPPLPELWSHPRAVLCIGHRTLLDDAASLMLSDVLSKAGFGVEVSASGTLSTANLFQLDASGVQLICLSCMDGGSNTLRYAVRRLRRKIPAAKIIMCCWNAERDSGTLQPQAQDIGADAVVKSTRDALGCAREMTMPLSANVPISVSIAQAG